MTHHPSASVSRRQFLVGTGVATGAVLLGACGGTSSPGSASPTTAAGSGLSLVQFFGGLPMLVAGSKVRAPFGMADGHGLLPVDKTPAELTVTLAGPDGKPVGQPSVVRRHGEGLPRSYYPLHFTVADPGIYTGRTEVEGQALEMAIKVDAAADVSVIQPGAALPRLTTPTTTDAHGVNPICTRDPVCALHDTTADAVVAQGRPLALLIASPAFCQVAICGPVLDVLLGVVDRYPKVTFLHEEVYAHPKDNLDEQAPVVGELGLAFEPCLVLVGSNGRVVDRLDTIFDTHELNDALALLT